MKPTRAIARKVLEVVDCGLVKGVGVQKPGEMCIEAAVCFAFGRPHGDQPPCVGDSVREFKINLNDCPWSSDKARGDGMRKLASAQLGSNEIDQQRFKELLAFKGITKVLPFYIRKYVEKYKSKLTGGEQEKILSFALRFQSAPDRKIIEKIMEEKTRIGFGFGFGFDVGFDVGFGFGFGEFKEFFGDEFLIKTADIGLECLVELKSPGCEFLDLCGEKDSIVA